MAERSAPSSRSGRFPPSRGRVLPPYKRCYCRLFFRQFYGYSPEQLSAPGIYPASGAQNAMQLSLPVSDCWYGSNTAPCEYLQDRVFYLQSRDKNAPLWAIEAHCTEGYRGLIFPSGKASNLLYPGY
ncbi:hypothetical protein BW70_03570 [Escherichia coli O174:H8 str. 04-3038]|nr:hypothetical protein BW70_03570 [Escherichia coli O174:H8 str. 04-3038]